MANVPPQAKIDTTVSQLMIEPTSTNNGCSAATVRGRLTIPSTGFTEAGENWILSLQNTDVMGMSCHKGSDINLNSID
ncbi:hypothetical protein J6590_073080 [Homalodisca vitripennis]|nr:hypothetical protein J6590_073080 [Homalodisca vitripennis]